MKTIKLFLLLICLSWSLIGCGKLKIENFSKGDRIESSPAPVVKPVTFNNPAGKLSEVAPPTTIQELAKISDRSPQIEFTAPQSDRTLNDANVEVELKIQNLSLFRNKQLGLGPHINLILDNQPAREIYDIENPIILENLAPGTHTLRAFAVLPWNESYKNEEAFAQTTFHILTKTNNNNPNRDRPLLTYNSPEGMYGAEPILLDFYLSNAPLHLIARENPDDEIKDWRIKVTINGESFILEEWQPIYLTGFERGNNWVQIELLDEEGNNLENAFNNTVRLVTYEPKAEDSLAKIVTGEISAAEALSILEIQPVETPKIIEPEVSKEETKIIEEPPIAPEESELPKTAIDIPLVETPNTEPIEIEPETSDIEIIEIEENEKPIAEIKISPTKEDNSAIEPTDENLQTTSIEIIEIEENETEKPIAEIKLPSAAKSVEITETKSANELPEPETTPKPKLKTPEWLTNLWNNLRQKVKSITRLLSDRDTASKNI